MDFFILYYFLTFNLIFEVTFLYLYCLIVILNQGNGLNSNSNSNSETKFKFCAFLRQRIIMNIMTTYNESSNSHKKL